MLQTYLANALWARGIAATVTSRTFEGGEYITVNTGDGWTTGLSVLWDTNPEAVLADILSRIGRPDPTLGL